MKGRYTGKNNHFFNKTHSDRVKKIIGENTKNAAALQGHGTFFGREHTVESKQKMSISSKGLNTGSKHYNHKGWWVTPWGKFPSVQSAIDACPKKVGFDAIRSWCIHNNNIPIIRSSKNNGFMTKNDIGKTPHELGFLFESAYYDPQAS